MEKSTTKLQNTTLKNFLQNLSDVDCIKIIGCNPMVSTLTSSAFEIALRNRITSKFENSSKSNDPFFTLYIESEQEDFYQQLTDFHGPVSYKNNYIDKKIRLFGIKQENYKSALVADITRQIISRCRLDGETPSPALIGFVQKSIIVKQMNFRLPYDAVYLKKGKQSFVWYHPLSLNVPDIDDYIYLDENVEGFAHIKNIILQHLKYFETDELEKHAVYSDTEDKTKLIMVGGKKYTSLPGAELLEAYDKNNKRVAVFDRKAFLTLEYKRASIWGFIFNRRGQLLLHRRSQTTADNRGLWDKSTGGHVDLTDASTVETAKREFIEELYTKDSEFSKYNSSKTEMIVDFGEWRRALRADESFIEAFTPFTGNDSHVIMFRAFTEGSNCALTVDRASVRKISKPDGTVVDKDTRFRSDVFFFITAENEMDTDEQMFNTFEAVGKGMQDAASGHRLVEIPDLVNEVLTNKDAYTDDLVYVVKDYSGYLTEFSSFVKETFARIKKSD